MIVRKTAATALGVLLATLAVTPAPAAAAGDPERSALRETLDAVPEGGVYGVYSAVRAGRLDWRGAAGAADPATGRPTRPDMYHRVGSITKSFTATAVLQQVDRGRLDLDAPVERYLPGLLPDARVTVRMLLNHTSHLGDYDEALITGPEDLETMRTRSYAKRELVELGLSRGGTGEPGQLPGVYSNTNYVVLGLLLAEVTGEPAEAYITREVIERAGLRDTFFPRTRYLPRPHANAYTSFLGYWDPPRDFTVFDMSWASTAGAIVATMPDLNRFYRALLGGRLISAAAQAQLRRTVPVLPAAGWPAAIEYGLGLVALDLPCGVRAWGHDGVVIGMATVSLTTEDLARQVSYGTNLTWHPGTEASEEAAARHLLTALCGTAQPAAKSTFRLPGTDAPLPLTGSAAQ